MKIARRLDEPPRCFAPPLPGRMATLTLRFAPHTLEPPRHRRGETLPGLSVDGVPARSAGVVWLHLPSALPIPRRFQVRYPV
ncbi:MAG: hypothetical protein U1F76_00925 [Candidatus Competibacteraceae bacterium]